MLPVMGRFLYAPEDTGAGSGGNADTGGKKVETGTPDSSTTSGDRKFTQAEVDEIVKSRIGKEKAKYADYDTLRAKANELAQKQEELEKRDLEAKGKYDQALERTETRYKTELEKVAGERDDWQKRYETLAIDNALTAEAAKLGAIDPGEVVVLLRPSVSLGADHVPSFEDGKSLADGVKVFLDARPHLVKANSRGGGSGSNHDAGVTKGGSPVGKQLSEMTDDERAAIKEQFGSLSNYMRQNKAGVMPWDNRGKQQKVNG